MADEYRRVYTPRHEYVALGTPCDLSETGLLEAVSIMTANQDHPHTLVCGQSEIDGPSLAEAFRLRLAPVPDAVLKLDSWAIVGRKTVVWST